MIHPGCGYLDASRPVLAGHGKGDTVPQWSRIFVLLTGIGAWLAIVGVSLKIGEIPSAVVVGFPAGLWIALKGQSTIGPDRSGDDDPAAPEAAADERDR